VTAQKSITTVDSMLLSEYILEKGGAMSHLKLQKILYYIQALHLAYFDKPIITDEFQAWLHGPVSRKIYDELKGYSKLYAEVAFEKGLDKELPSEILKKTLTADQLELVDEIIDEYGKLTSSQLENLTHSEEPWIEARIGYGVADRCEVVIPIEKMRTYYKKEIYGKQ
jgi:uncharacterized phage-associated protein